MDVIEVEILEDGTIKSSTTLVSMADHSAADKFFAFLKGLCGGEQKRKAKEGHVHTHGTVTHSH